MPFGSFFKKAFTKGAANLAKQCGAGEGVVDMVEDAVEDGFDQVSQESHDVSHNAAGLGKILLKCI